MNSTFRVLCLKNNKNIKQQNKLYLSNMHIPHYWIYLHFFLKLKSIKSES